MSGTRPRRRSSSSHAYPRHLEKEHLRPQMTARSYTSEDRVPGVDARLFRRTGHLQDTKMFKMQTDRNVTKRKRWPPSPFVEDEVDSLSKELGSSYALEFCARSGGEVPSRGTVDQQPILVEVHPSTETPHRPKDSQSHKADCFRDAQKIEPLNPQRPVPPPKGPNVSDTDDDDVLVAPIPRREPSPYAYTKNAIPSGSKHHGSPGKAIFDNDAQSSNGSHLSQTPSWHTATEDYPSSSSAAQYTGALNNQPYNPKDWHTNERSWNSQLNGDDVHQYNDYQNSHGGNPHISGRSPASMRQSGIHEGLGWHNAPIARSSSPSATDTRHESRQNKLRPSSWGGRPSSQSWEAVHGRRDIQSPSIIPSPPRSPSRNFQGSEGEHHLKVKSHAGHSPATSSRPPSPLSPHANWDPRPSKQSSYNGYSSSIDPDEPFLNASGNNPHRNSTFPVERPRIEVTSPSSHQRTPSAPIYLREQAPFLHAPPKLGPRSASYSDRGHSPSAPLHNPRPHPSQPAPRPWHPSRHHDSDSPQSSMMTESFKAQLEALRKCRRSRPSAHYNDWFTMIEYPKYDICPSCLDSVICENGFQDFFRPSAPKPPGTRTRCMFSYKWVQLAWILTLRRNWANLNLIYAILHVISTEQPCPGESGTCSHWFAPIESRRNTVIDFLICGRCIALLGVVFPFFRGCYQRLRVHPPDEERACGLRVGSTRFAGYVEILEFLHQHTLMSRVPPTIDRFVSYVDRRLDLAECRRDDQLRGNVWHFINGVPEFTVCEECYVDVIRPEVQRGSMVARQVHPCPRRLLPQDEPVSCQLYSERMRNAFKLASTRDDLDYLIERARKRKEVEEALQEEFSDLISSEPGVSEEGFLMRRDHGELMDDHSTAAQLDRIAETWRRWE